MKKVRVTAEILEPIVFAASSAALMTKAEEVFSGSAMLGAMAKRYIEAKSLGSEAHLDSSFREIFLRGGVRFLPSYPSADGRRGVMLPLSVQKDKITGALCDTLFDGYQAGYKPLKGCAVIEGGRLTMLGAAKQVSLHMSRSSEQERISGKSEDGNIYNYEALASGQTFMGELIGEAELLQELINGLNLPKSDIFYFGRSKYTQYGKCRLSFGKLEELPEPTGLSDEVCLWCVTPLISEADASSAAAAFAECAAALNEMTDSDAFSIVPGSIISASEAVEGFVGIWGLRRPNELALSAGSVCRLAKKGGWSAADKAALQELMYGGIGRRCGEGFGQLRIWQQQKLTLQEAPQGQAKLEQPKLATPVRSVASRIVMSRVLEQMRQFAFSDAQHCMKQLSGKKHLFSRLEDMLGERVALAGCKDRFHKKIAAELTTNGQAKKHLQAIKMGSEELWDILCGKADMPYAKRLDWNKLLGAEMTELAGIIDLKLPNKNSDQIFYEYCLWLFRHARKQAFKAEEKGAAVNE